ncbi:hypothetical protein CLCR_08038 [Cladophialophora carrionii]|uniref:Zn(2)-C6 fungal-type domain-containing protein n=1 Tax=Cladophialophora carrionii TaxID=86049 RepID=A0A1C1CTJ1_9EURO|nr:hypothetical protein CLCR_08038 [Cladophialophora carrionii]
MDTTPSVGHDGDLPSSPPKRRKLKHPRTARACLFCRRRKVRCSGTQPCDYCNGEGVRCEYDGVAKPPARDLDRVPLSTTHHVQAAQSPSVRQPGFFLGVNSRETHPTQPASTRDATNSKGQGPDPLATVPNAHTPRISRGPSLEPTFAEGHHIGATAGVSFLYHTLNRGEVAEAETNLPTAPLTCHGDIPPMKVRQDQPMPSREEADALLERYSRFATPTYRFLHRPTLEKWTSGLLTGARLSTAEAACTLLVFSQALLYMKDNDRYVDGGDQDLHRSQFYFEKAKSLLNQEPGPASLASVQSRLALCLYLLSTFRINECRYVFSLACTILTSLGLHRKSSAASSEVDLVALESRKRTFWCAYVLDDYLSVMLGRPRMLRDEDIDQPYPRNIDDQDLLSSESPDELPLHGNLEAFIAHADLAKLMGRNSDLLYPLHPLTDDQLFDRTNEMLESVTQWRDRLPDFLKPRDKTLAGQRTFERQNTVLKLAYAHLRILVTRRCLLADFSRLGHSTPSPAPSSLDDRALEPVQECVAAITTILNATHDLVQRNALYQAFWFTQYIALVAISTLYVYVIQSSRARLPAGIFPGLDAIFDKALLCQDYLAKLAPEGSQARRHCHLLSRLRLRAEKDAARARKMGTGAGAGVGAGAVVAATVAADSGSESSLPARANVPSAFEAATTRGPVVESAGHEREIDSQRDTGASDHQDGGTAGGTGGVGENFRGLEASNLDLDIPADKGMITAQFTPSEDDFMFQNLLGWGWETLDTVGFPGDGDVFKLSA